MSRFGYKHSKSSPLGQVWDGVDRAIGLGDSVQTAIAAGGLLAAGIITTMTYWLAPEQTMSEDEIAVARSEAQALAASQREKEQAEKQHAAEMAESGWGGDDSAGWGRR